MSAVVINAIAEFKDGPHGRAVLRSAILSTLHSGKVIAPEGVTCTEKDGKVVPFSRYACNKLVPQVGAIELETIRVFAQLIVNDPTLRTAHVFVLLSDNPAEVMEQARTNSILLDSLTNQWKHMALGQALGM
ncbi:hypothetical protein ACQKFS_03155 [Pseudomonas guineae]|uniref:hypothetical protein n=1 Tax=Pseudomonas guineae TaxID=425504 RepID=UPI003D0424F4